jgi:hypothetical protein
MNHLEFRPLPIYIKEDPDVTQRNVNVNSN